jgi:hypothetical protein
MPIPHTAFVVTNSLRQPTSAEGRRIFFLDVWGGTGHAINDSRKVAEMECYESSENLSELTARIDDEGWPQNWLLREPTCCGPQ